MAGEQPEEYQATITSIRNNDMVWVMGWWNYWSEFLQKWGISDCYRQRYHHHVTTLLTDCMLSEIQALGLCELWFQQDCKSHTARATMTLLKNHFGVYLI